MSNASSWLFSVEVAIKIVSCQFKTQQKHPAEILYSAGRFILFKY